MKAISNDDYPLTPEQVSLLRSDSANGSDDSALRMLKAIAEVCTFADSAHIGLAIREAMHGLGVDPFDVDVGPYRDKP